MARALTAVGALLALAFILLGAVVYLTRSEDRIAVDNPLGTGGLRRRLRPAPSRRSSSSPSSR